MLKLLRIVAMIIGLCFWLMFFFVPETFWDRTPRPRSKKTGATLSIAGTFNHPDKDNSGLSDDRDSSKEKAYFDHKKTVVEPNTAALSTRPQLKSTNHVGFQSSVGPGFHNSTDENPYKDQERGSTGFPEGSVSFIQTKSTSSKLSNESNLFEDNPLAEKAQEASNISRIRNSSKPSTNQPETSMTEPATPGSIQTPQPSADHRYTENLQNQPRKTFTQTLKPWNGTLRNENWLLVALRPFILYAYPSILWSTLVYSLSIGWLIVLSESVAYVYRNKETYNFSSLGTGLVYLSPFIGGVLGTAVAGKVSDVIVRFMSRRNGGLYEPEFRLVMTIPVALSTCIGLMGFGWSVEEKDKWIVPTVFFGVISFGCSLGSTTAITFAVDSYRQYAGEALVTLNFSKSAYIPTYPSPLGTMFSF